MSNPELEKLAQAIAQKLAENWETTNETQAPDVREGDVIISARTQSLESTIALSAEEQAALADIQQEFLQDFDDRTAGLAAFNQELNTLIDTALEQTLAESTDLELVDRTAVSFEIPDLNTDTPGFEPRDQQIAKALQSAPSLTAYQVLELDNNVKTNLTLRTAEDVYNENKAFYDSTPIAGQNIRSGQDIVRLLNSGTELDAGFQNTLTEQINEHFLTQKSSVHVVREGSRGLPGSKLKGASMEYRSRTMGELAEALNDHENANAVLQGIYETMSIVPEVDASPKSITTDNDRRGWLTKDGDLTPEEQQMKLAEIKSSIIDMSNYFGPTGTDLIITGLMNNPELLDKPFMEAWKQLNPSTQGENGRIARAYLKEETVFQRITEDFETQDPNATLGTLLRHTISRDVPKVVEVPEVKAQAEKTTKIETPDPVEVKEELPEKKPTELGVYARGEQFAYDENSTIQSQSYGVSLDIPTEKGSVDIDAGVRIFNLNTNRRETVVEGFQTFLEDGQDAYIVGDRSIVLADRNDPDAAALGEPVNDLVQTDANGNRYVEAGHVGAYMEQNAEAIAAELNVRVNNDEKNFSIEAGGFYGANARGLNAGFEKRTEKGAKFGVRGGAFTLDVDTDVTIEKDPIDTVVTLYEGVPAGVGEDGRPVFDPEVQTRIDEYENVELIPRTETLEQVPDKDKFVKEAGILVKDPYVIPQEERVKPMGIIPKQEYVETEKELFIAKGIVPKEQWVQPLKYEDTVYAMDACLPKRKWTCGANGNWSWTNVPGQSVSIAEAAQEAANFPNNPPYSAAELNDPNLWTWSVIQPPQAITTDEADAYTLPDGTGPVSIPQGVRVLAESNIVNDGPRIPLADLGPDQHYDAINDTDDWRVIDGAPLMTQDQANAAGIPSQFQEWQVIDGQYFTQEQVDEYGIPDSELESVSVGTGDLILLSEAEANGTPYVAGSNQWIVEDGAEPITLAEAEALGMPASEHEWVVIDGEPVTQQQATDLGYPENLWETVVVTDPNATPIPLEDAGDLYDPDSVTWQVSDPAEYLTLAEAEAAAAQGLPNMPTDEFEWAIIPGGQLLTPDEANTLGIPQEIQDVVWVENGELITVQEANQQGIPYEDSEIITSQIPELDSEGNQLYDVVRTVDGFENQRTDEHHITKTQMTDVTDIRSESRASVVYASAYGIVPLSDNLTLSGDLNFQKTWRAGTTIGGTTTTTVNTIDEHDDWDVAPTDDETIESVDYPNNDDIAIGMVEGNGSMTTPLVSNNSFLESSNTFRTNIDGTATKAFAGLGLNWNMPKNGLNLGVRGEGGIWNTKSNVEYLLDEVQVKQTTLNQTKGFLSAGFNATQAFKDGSSIGLFYQSKNLVNPSDASASERFGIRVKKTIGGGKSREERKLEAMKKADEMAEKAEEFKTAQDKTNEIKDNMPSNTEVENNTPNMENKQELQIPKQ